MRRLVFLMGAVAAVVIAAVTLGAPLGARNEAGPATTGLAQSYPDNPSDVACTNPSCFDVASVDISNTSAGQITVRINVPNRTRTNIVSTDNVSLHIDSDRNNQTGGCNGYEYRISMQGGAAGFFVFDRYNAGGCGAGVTQLSPTSFSGSLSPGVITFTFNKADVGTTTGFDFGILVQDGDQGGAIVDFVPEGALTVRFTYILTTTPPPPPPPPTSTPIPPTPTRTPTPPPPPGPTPTRTPTPPGPTATPTPPPPPPPGTPTSTPIPTPTPTPPPPPPPTALPTATPTPPPPPPTSSTPRCTSPLDPSLEYRAKVLRNGTRFRYLKLRVRDVPVRTVVTFRVGRRTDRRTAGRRGAYASAKFRKRLFRRGDTLHVSARRGLCSAQLRYRVDAAGDMIRTRR